MTYGFLLGVLISIVASLFSSAGYLLQKLAHLRQGEVPRARYCNALWIGGLTCLALAAVSDYVALAFVAQSVVAPLGAVTLLCNLFLGPLILGEQLTPGSLSATAVIVVGNVIAITFFSSGAAHSSIASALLVARLSDWDMVVYSAGFVAGLVYLRRRNTRLALTISSGMLSATSMMAARVLSLMTKDALGAGRVHDPLVMLAVLAGIAVTLAFQLQQIDECLRRFQATFVVPIAQSSMCLASLSHGMVCFREYRGLSPARLALFCAGVAITVVGQITLSQGGFSALLGSEKSSPNSDGNAVQMEIRPLWARSRRTRSKVVADDDENKLLIENDGNKLLIEIDPNL